MQESVRALMWTHAELDGTDLGLSRWGVRDTSVRKDARAVPQTADQETDMSELPARTNGGVRVRGLGRGDRGPHVIGRSPDSAVTGPAARTAPLKFLRFPEVRERTGLSRSTIWRLERRGEFPKHHRISPNIVAWVDHDVAAWITRKATPVAS